MSALASNLERTYHSDSAETARHLSALFQYLPNGAYIAPWTMDNGEPSGGASFTDTAKAAQWSAQQAEQGKDVYIHVGYSNKPAPRGGRYKAKDITGITTLWADVDIRDNVHKKDNLPPVEAAARALVAEIGLAPSLLIHSGHGLQAWWLLAEPLAHDDAALISEAWKSMLKARVAAHGWEIDSVGDLARVMRVAGTVNRKDKAAPVPVRLIECDETRQYTPDQIRAAIASAPQIERTPRTPASASAPAEPLRMDDARVHKQASHGKHGAKYLPLYYGDDSGYSSPSEADMAYVRCLERYTSDAAQIDRMWLASPRANQRDPKKIQRKDYRERTIGKVLADPTEQDADELGNDSSAETSTDTSDEPDEALAASGEATAADSEKTAQRKRDLAAKALAIAGRKGAHVPLDYVRQLGTQKGTFDLVLTDGRRVPIGTASDFCRYASMRDALFYAGYVLKPQKSDAWLDTLTKLRAVTRIEETETEEQETEDWLAAFHSKVGGYAFAYFVDNTEDDDINGRGRVAALTYLQNPSLCLCATDRQGRLYVSTQRLTLHVRTEFLQFTTPKAIAARLATLGFKPQQLTATGTRTDGTRYSLKQRVFVSPPGYVDVETYNPLASGWIDTETERMKQERVRATLPLARAE